jgi:hypothetical protein
MPTEIHKKLTDRESIAAAVKYINEMVNGRGFNFMEDTAGEFTRSLAWRNIKEPNILIILASFDFSYYHDLEIVFYDVSYTTIGPEYSWWDHWTKDQLELSEKDFPDGFEFRFNRGTNTDVQYIVHAKAFSYHFEKIVYRQ